MSTKDHEFTTILSTICVPICVPNYRGRSAQAKSNQHNTRINHKTPQKPVKPEDCNFPQQIGPATALDFDHYRNTPPAFASFSRTELE